MSKQNNDSAAEALPPHPDEDEARAKVAADILVKARVLHTQAEYCDLRMIAYLLDLVMVEAEDVLARAESEQ